MDWTQKPRLVKHGLDSFSKTWTGLKSARFVKHGLDSFSKTWTGLKSARLVKHGLKTETMGGEGGGDIRSTYNKQSRINNKLPISFSVLILISCFLVLAGACILKINEHIDPRIFNVNMNH